MKTKPLLIAAAPILALSACNVATDEQNGTTVMTVDHNRVEDAADRAGNIAERAANEAGDALQNAAPAIENAAEDIGARAERVGDRVENQVDRVDVDVNVRNDNVPAQPQR